MAQNERPHLQKLLIKPPLQGLNIHDNPLDLDVNFAYELTNFLPPTTFLEVRPGVRGITTLDGISLGLYSYSVGAIKTYSKGSIFKSTQINEPATSFIVVKLLDVSGQVVIYSLKPEESKESEWTASLTELGRSSSYTRDYATDFCTCNTTIYFTDGGESNSPYMYTPRKAITQMAWRSPAQNKYATEDANITDVENLTAYNGFFFCNSKNSLNIYYMKTSDIDPDIDGSKGWVNRIFTPKATGIINLGGVLQKGGSILKMFTMSAVRENNIAQYLCVITTLGELLVYKGTNPADVAKWELNGNFTVPVPLNKRCFCNIEGDMVIATETGFVSLHRIIFNSTTKITEALEKRISNLFQQYEFRTSGYKEFFFLQYYYKRRLVIFNVPEMLPASLHQVKTGYEVDTQSVLYLTANYTTNAFFETDVKDFIINYIYKHSIDYRMIFEFDGDTEQGIFFEVHTTPFENTSNPLHLGGNTDIRLYVREMVRPNVYNERNLIGYVDKSGTLAGIEIRLKSDNIMWGVDSNGNYITPPSVAFVYPVNSEWYGWIGDMMSVLIGNTPTMCSVYRFLQSHTITNVLSYARPMDLPANQILGTDYSITGANLGPFFTLSIPKRDVLLPVNGSVNQTNLRYAIASLTNIIYGRSKSDNRSINAPYIPSDYTPWFPNENPPPTIYDLGSNYISHTTMPDNFNPDQPNEQKAGLYSDDLPLFEWSAMVDNLKKIYIEFRDNPSTQPIDFFSRNIYTDVTYKNSAGDVVLYRFNTKAEFSFVGTDTLYWEDKIDLPSTMSDNIYWTSTNFTRFAEVNVKATTTAEFIGGKIGDGRILHELNLLTHTVELSGHLTRFFGWDGEIPTGYELPIYFRYDSQPLPNLVNLFDGLKESFSSSSNYIVIKVEIVKEGILYNENMFSFASITKEKIEQFFGEWPIAKVESQTTGKIHTDVDFVGCGLWFMYFIYASRFDVNSHSRYSGNVVHDNPALIPFINGLGITRDYKSSQYVFDTNYGTWSKWEGINMVDAVEHDNEFFFVKLEETSDAAHRKARLCKFDYDFDGDDPWDTGIPTPIICSYRGGHSDLGVPHLKKQFKIAGIYGSKPAFWTIDVEPPVEFQFSLDFVEQPNVIYPYYKYGIPLEKVLKSTHGYPMILAIELDKAGILKPFKDMTYQEKKKYYKIYATLSQQVAYIELPLISNPANRISVGCKMIVKKHGIFIYGYELYFEEVNP
jgi:hypothetical protein